MNWLLGNSTWTGRLLAALRRRLFARPRERSSGLAAGYCSPPSKMPASSFLCLVWSLSVSLLNPCSLKHARIQADIHRHTQTYVQTDRNKHSGYTHLRDLDYLPTCLLTYFSTYLLAYLTTYLLELLTCPPTRPTYSPVYS